MEGIDFAVHLPGPEHVLQDEVQHVIRQVADLRQWHTARLAYHNFMNGEFAKLPIACNQGKLTTNTQHQDSCSAAQHIGHAQNMRRRVHELQCIS